MHKQDYRKEKCKHRNIYVYSCDSLVRSHTQTTHIEKWRESESEREREREREGGRERERGERERGGEREREREREREIL